MSIIRPKSAVVTGAGAIIRADMGTRRDLTITVGPEGLAAMLCGPWGPLAVKVHRGEPYSPCLCNKKWWGRRGFRMWGEA